MTNDLKIRLEADWEPMRDWFPLSSYSASPVSWICYKEPTLPGVGASAIAIPIVAFSRLLVVNRQTGDFTPLFKFFDYEQFIKDVAVITDTARGKKLTAAQLALAIMRNYKADQAPEGFPISQIVNLFKPSSTKSNSDRNDRMKTRDQDQDDWRVLCVEGMWFQDLWTYDFRRTEMCVIPYGTQEGEISFCAYNTGVGWRQIIENMHKTATLAEWHRTEGRHEIFAKGKSVQLKTAQHSLTLPIIQPSSGSSWMLQQQQSGIAGQGS